MAKRELTEKDLDNYVPVHERIQQFWQTYPNGSIQSLIENVNDTTVRCIVHVKALAGGPVIASGHAEERRDDGDMGPFAVECAETSAIGRALAIAGFSSDKGVASRQEMQKVARLQQQEKVQNGNPQEPTLQDAIDAHGGDVEAATGLTLDEPTPSAVAEERVKALIKQMLNLDPRQKQEARVRFTALGIENPAQLGPSLRQLDAEGFGKMEHWVQKINEPDAS